MIFLCILDTSGLSTNARYASGLGEWKIGGDYPVELDCGIYGMDLFG